MTPTPSEARQVENVRAQIIAILKAHTKEMEGYSYFSSNPGVPEDDYEEIADEITRALRQGGEAVECLICGGDGIDPEPAASFRCCDSLAINGECCGDPNVEPEPQPCRQCSGAGRVTPALPPPPAEGEAA